MIYEIAVVFGENVSDDNLQGIKTLISTIAQENSGELLLDDDWGVRHFAQPTGKGVKKGRYFYALYQGGPNVNTEIERRLRIDESVQRFVLVRKGPLAKKQQILKEYQSPFAV